MSLLFTGMATAQPIPEILVDPPCSSTTCISIEAIALAKHADIEFDYVPTYIDQLSVEFACNTVKSDMTGITVLKQIPQDIERFGDSFCTLQGCAGNSAQTEIIGTIEETTPLPCVN